MTDIDRRTFARYALVCIVGGLMIGYGCAWIFSTPVIIYRQTMDYQQTVELGDIFGSTYAVEVHYIDPGTGLVIMLVMLAAGTVIGVMARYLPPVVMEWWETRENTEEVE
jgi:hypothetical protein